MDVAHYAVYNDKEFNSFVLKDSELDLEKTFNCGQTFMWDRETYNVYSGVIGSKIVALGLLTAEAGEVEPGYTRVVTNLDGWYARYIFSAYLNWDMNYENIVDELNLKESDAYAYKCYETSKGIHILRQPLWETVVTFMISQNNNMANIRNCVHKLCEKFGKKLTENFFGINIERYTFPSEGALAFASLEDLRECSLGFRAEYIQEFAKSVVRGKYNLKELSSCSYDSAMSKLKEVRGIGDKIANCICLFALGHYDAFPVDVHMQRIIDREYSGEIDLTKYGEYAGIIQQFMFYTETNKGLKY